MKLNRLGDYGAARLGIREVGERIAGYAGRDPELRALLGELRNEEERWAAPMQAMELKAVHSQASYALRSRAIDGRAHR